MDTLRSVVRFLGVTVTLIFVLAVSGAFGDEINGGRPEDLIRVEAVGTSWGSVTRGWHQGGFEAIETFSGSRFADFNSGFSVGQDEFFGRTNGIRDGYWLRLSLDDHYGNWSNTVGGSDTAMPEPASLLLLVTGVGPLLYARRRALKA